MASQQPQPAPPMTTMAKALRAAEAAALQRRAKRAAVEPGPKEGPWAGVPGYECRKVCVFVTCCVVFRCVGDDRSRPINDSLPFTLRHSIN